jgi:hypothetical protein
MKQLFYIIPVMLYYFIESIISATPINLIWKFFFAPKFNFEILYIHWVLIIWMIKVIFFDVFKFAAMIDADKEKNKTNNDER